MFKRFIQAIKLITRLSNVCQCKDCKHSRYILGKTARLCINIGTDSYGEVMNPYGSCEKCERR